MSIDRIFQRAKNIKKETYYLIIVLSLGIFINIFPHLNYPYLLHVDEWFHVAEAKQIILGSKIDWYTGEPFTLGMERGWHCMLSIFYFLFKPSISQWIILPTILHVFAITVVYYFISKLYDRKNGIISAFLVAILPSNVTMGGPVFLIPVNLSLIVIPSALLFAFRLVKISDFYSYLALFLIATFTLYTHPPTAVVLFTLLGIYFLLNILSKEQDSRKNSLYLLVTLLLSFIISLPNFIPEIQKKGLDTISFDFWVYLQGIPLLYGLLPTIFFVIGFYFYSKTDKKETWSLLLTSVILIFNVLFFSWFGLSYILPYQRTHIPLFLLMSIIGSRGYTQLLHLKNLGSRIGSIFLVICLLSTAGLSIGSHLQKSYYHLIDDVDYEDFIWIKENTPENATVVADPLKARTLATVAERSVFGVMPFGPEEVPLMRVSMVYRFFEENCTNTTFLRENAITIIYTRDACNNTDLIKRRDNIYFLKN